MKELLDPVGDSRGVGVRRIWGDGSYWRVIVETWDRAGEIRGRLRFEPEGRVVRRPARWGPPSLRGESRAEVLGAAMDLPDRSLERLFRSLA